MTQRLHLVFGGELIDPTTNMFKDTAALGIVGLFSGHASAFYAWKSAAYRTINNAHMWNYIAHPHRLRDEAAPALSTPELG